MRWYPKLEIYNGAWETLPRDSFFDAVEIDKSVGEATVARFTIKRAYVPTNPLDWIGRQVRVSISIWGDTEYVDHLLFDGLIRRPSLDVVSGTVRYECATLTAAMFGTIPTLIAQLDNEVPWCEAVFGVREELTRDEIFNRLLSASKYKVVENQLRDIRADIAFDRDIGEEIDPNVPYAATHTAADVIGLSSGSGSVSGAITVDITDPSISTPAGQYSANGQSATTSTAVDPNSVYASIPLGVVKPAPLNEVVCEVRHRYKRLVQEAFHYDYSGGNLYTDHGINGAWMLTAPSLDSAIQGTGLHVLTKNVSPAPYTQKVGDIEWVAPDSIRFSLVSAFNLVGARRYVQDCEMVYRRVYRANDSIRRYGVSSETRTIVIEDKNDYTPFTEFEWLPRFENSAYFKVDSREDYETLARETILRPADEYWDEESTAAAIKKMGLNTSSTVDNVQLAIDTVLAIAERDVLLAHSTSDENAANRHITTTYAIPATPANLALVVGDRIVLSTTQWTIAGVISALVYTLATDGSAVIDVTLSTSIAPNEPEYVPPVYNDATGKWYDPLTGAEYDPVTGMLTDPATGEPIKRITSTGAPVPPDPVASITQYVAACVGYDGEELPQGGMLS